jgi:hypothetical protein
MASDEMGVELKHLFFDESMNLVGLLKKHIAKRIGIVTSTVENETRLVLEEAAREEIISRSLDEFKLLSVVVNACEDRLDTILGYLLREPIDMLERSKYYARVRELYDSWITYGHELDVSETASAKAEAVSKGYKKEAFKIYKRQDYERNRQAIRLSKSPIDETDKLILSEAAYLYNLYKQTEGKETKVFLASTDTHFSPTRGTLVSRVVTDDISTQLGVICDWPNDVAKAVRELVS